MNENLGLQKLEMNELLRSNLQCSVDTILLLNADFETGKQFSLKRLFVDIIKLSYDGELRSYLKAESQDKQLQIFEGSQARFAALYNEVLDERLKAFGLVCSQDLGTNPLAGDQEFDDI